MLVRDRLGKKPLALRAAARRLARVRVRDEGAAAACRASRASSTSASSTRSSRCSTCPRSGLRAVEKVPPGSYARRREDGSSARRALLVGAGPGSPAGSCASTTTSWLERGARRGRRRGRAAARRRRAARRAALGRHRLLDRRRGDGAGASSGPVRTFTVGFPDARYDERAYARARRRALRHAARGARDRARRPTLERLLATCFDEPFGDEAALPLLLVCEATRRHVTVALVGDGGDEVFGGYERYAAHALAGRGPARRGRCAERARCGLPAGAARAALDRSFRARRLPRRRPRTPRAERYASADGGLPARAAAAALDGRGARARRRSPTCRRRATCARSTSSRTCRATCCRSPTSPRWRVSLELRSPLLDHRVVELGLSLPLAAASRQGGCCAGVRRRPAAADRAPRQDGLRRPARPLVPRASCGRSRTTCCSAARTAGSSAAPSSSGCCDEHAAGSADHGHRLWCLVHARAVAADARRRAAGPALRDRVSRRGAYRPARRALRRAAPRRAAARARRHPRRLHREELALRERLPRHGHVRLHPAARRRRTRSRSTRWFLIPIVLALRPVVARGRARADRRRGRARRFLVYEIGRRVTTRRAGRWSRR